MVLNIGCICYLYIYSLYRRCITLNHPRDRLRMSYATLHETNGKSYDILITCIVKRRMYEILTFYDQIAILSSFSSSFDGSNKCKALQQGLQF